MALCTGHLITRNQHHRRSRGHCAQYHAPNLELPSDGICCSGRDIVRCRTARPGAAGYSLRQLAPRVYISHDLLARIEKAPRTPSLVLMRNTASKAYAANTGRVPGPTGDPNTEHPNTP